MSRKPQTDQARTAGDAHLHDSILDNLSDGVITIGLDGCIADFNAAASHMFGFSRHDVLGKTLAEVFLTIQGFDEFIETILDSITNPVAPSRKVVNVQTADGPKALTLTISHLRKPNEERENKLAGVIAVFGDITELKELRETEVRMAEELEEQHTDLQKAYRKIEENRDELNWALKRVQVTRTVTMSLVLVLFLGIGIWNWVASDPEDWQDEIYSEYENKPGNIEGLQTTEVKTSEFKSRISLMGTLEPWRLVKVASPSDSHLRKTYFEYGQHVNQGERLIDLDIEELRLQYQESQIEYEKAHETVMEFRDWKNSTEMTTELRAFSRAKMTMDRAQSELKTSEFLLEQGLIPSSQYEDRKRSYESQLLEFDAAEQRLATTRARGQGPHRKAAELELERAQKKLHMLEGSLHTDSILAPVTGTILPLAQNEVGLTEGQATKKGDVLLTIADSEKVVAVTSVGEAEVIKIRIGQPVTIRGDAFPDLTIQGTVSHVSSQATQSNTRSTAASFKVIIEVESLDEMKRNRLRGGMSCRVNIVTYHNPSALMVPIEAVDVRGIKHTLRVFDPTTEVVKERDVELGLTSLNSVEILSGLSSGEYVILPE